uniref:Uncharacterized protein n=1 Tax=Eutreptiella gymnastica TaxID=73025 RepID=A0A7S4FW14_9EUGL
MFALRFRHWLTLPIPVDSPTPQNGMPSLALLSPTLFHFRCFSGQKALLCQISSGDCWIVRLMGTLSHELHGGLLSPKVEHTHKSLVLGMSMGLGGVVHIPCILVKHPCLPAPQCPLGARCSTVCPFKQQATKGRQRGGIHSRHLAL